MPHIDKPIIIALILFIILLLIFFLVAPEYQRFKDLQSELGIKKAEYNAEYDYYSAIVQTYYDLQSKTADVKKIDSALPSDPNLGKLVYFLQEQSSKSGLMLKSLFLTKAAVSSPGSSIKDISLSLNLIGNYSALESFISSLEKSARLFEIISVTFGSGETSRTETQFQTQSIFSFNMQIDTHTY
jgi:Tfp pilus assembly protein PilO